jgi:hypothetical protein
MESVDDAAFSSDPDEDHGRSKRYVTCLQRQHPEVHLYLSFLVDRDVLLDDPSVLEIIRTDNPRKRSSCLLIILQPPHKEGREILALL